MPTQTRLRYLACVVLRLGPLVGHMPSYACVVLLGSVLGPLKGQQTAPGCVGCTLAGWVGIWPLQGCAALAHCAARHATRAGSVQTTITSSLP